MFEHNNPMNGTPKWPDRRWNPYFGPWLSTITQPNIENTKRRIKKTLLYPPYKKHIFPIAHIEVFKCIIAANEEIDDDHIVNGHIKKHHHICVGNKFCERLS